MTDHILASLQAEIDARHENWHVAHYVTVVGLERLDSHANIERYISICTPDGQHDYITLGLLLKGLLVQAEQ